MPPLVLDGTNGVSGVDGTASNPAIEGTDSNTGVFFPAADTVAIGTGGTEALRVNSSQNVGIGIAAGSGDERLTVSVSNPTDGRVASLRNSGTSSLTGTKLWFNQNTVGNWNIGQPAGVDAFVFCNSTGSTNERARITSGGALWVGNTTDGSPAGNARIISYRNTAGNSFFAHQDVATNDTTAVIRQSVSGGNGGQNIGLLVQIQAQSNTDRIICGQFWNSGTPADRFMAYRNGDMEITGAVATKSTGTTWANPSDIRLKDNVRDYEKGLAELIQVRVREWEYNGKGGTTEGTHGLGVVADEVMLVLPRTVDEFEAKLNENDEEKTKLKRFDATEITWLLVKSIQELNAKVEAQAAEIAALKGAA